MALGHLLMRAVNSPTTEAAAAVASLHNAPLADENVFQRAK